MEGISRVNLVAALALTLLVAFAGWRLTTPAQTVEIQRTVVVSGDQMAPEGSGDDYAAESDGGTCTADDRLDCSDGDDFDDGNVDEMPVQTDSFPI